MKRLATALALLSVFAISEPLLRAQPRQEDHSANRDAHDAKDDAKQAGKDTGHAAKKTGIAVKKETKKGVHKSAEATRKGAAKVEGKTEPE
jgi:hypothetical protein